MLRQRGDFVGFFFTLLWPPLACHRPAITYVTSNPEKKVVGTDGKSVNDVETSQGRQPSKFLLKNKKKKIKKSFDGSSLLLRIFHDENTQK